MPNFIQSSPWLDAAEYGHALGNTLAQALFRMPHDREQQNIERQKLDLERQHIASQQALNETHGKYYEALANILPSKQETADRIAAEREQYHRESLDNRNRELTSKDNFRRGILDDRGRKSTLAEQLAPGIAALHGAQAKHLGNVDRNYDQDHLQDQLLKVLIASIYGSGGQGPDWMGPVMGDLGNRMRGAMKPQAPMGMPMSPGATNNSQQPSLMSQQQPQSSLMPQQQPGFSSTDYGPSPSIRQKFMQGQYPPMTQPNTGLTNPLMSPNGPDAMNPSTMGPPTPRHTIRARSRSSGTTGWATPEELQANPDLQPLQ